MKYLREVAITLAILAVLWGTYERFFSDKAKLIAELRDQIGELDAHIDSLRHGYAELEVREEERLQEIARLKLKLTEIGQQISDGEANIADIQNEMLSMGEALSIIEAHTRSARRRVRGALDLAVPPGGGPGSGRHPPD